MKTIYLVRHGKAESRDIPKEDFKRKLIKQGKKDMLQVVDRMKKQDIHPDLILTSPAPRATATARICAKHLKYKAKSIKSRKTLYEQGENALLDCVHGINEKYNSVMIVGHDPSMTAFVRYLVPDFNESLPTSGVAGIEFNTESWQEVSEGAGVLKLLDHPQPKEKKETIKSRINILHNELTDKYLSALLDMNIPLSNDIESIVRKLCRKIARETVKLQKKSGV
ncbi:histidine phosphatase family protein [bacterium]|nr:histidine phosphatase family protein [bacterium]